MSSGAAAGARAAAAARARLMAVARGELPGDVVFRGGTVVNVYSGELLPGHVELCEGRIAYVGRREPVVGPDTREVDCRHLLVAPAWIEPHCHPWEFYNPVGLAEAVVPGGTTTAVAENLFLPVVSGAQSTAPFLDALNACQGLPLRYLWMLRLMSQSAWPGEAEAFSPEHVIPLLDRPDVLGSAEITRWIELWRGDPTLLETVARVRSLGKRVDGHTAGASYERLNTLSAAGLSACHEAITAQEAADRLRLGLWTMLRHSSLRPDLPELVRAITEMGLSTQRLMVTMDGPSPRSIQEDGYIDAALRMLVQAGVPPVEALRMATLNPATYYGLDGELGGIAPGRQADLVLLPDLGSFRPEAVWNRGREVAREGRLLGPLPRVDFRGLGLALACGSPALFSDPSLFKPRTRDEVLPVIEAISNAITRAAGRAGWDDGGPPQGAVLAVLLDRQGRWATRAWLKGFGTQIDGFATTLNSAVQVLVLGRSPEDMAAAAERLVELGGGAVLARQGRIEWDLALPVAGLMVEGGFSEALAAQAALDARLRTAGFPFADVFYAFLFLTCDFLPNWRLTAAGVWDVKTATTVEPAWTRPAR